MYRSIYLYAVALLPILWLLAGCSGAGSGGDGFAVRRDTGVTNTLGEAYLDLSAGGGTETAEVHDSSTDRPLSSLQVLGLAEGSDRLFVAADPSDRYHPTITSGDPSGSFATRLYMTPADQRLGANTTTYTEVQGSLLYELAVSYSFSPRRTTVAGLRNVLASEASGNAAGLVVNVFKPLTSYAGLLNATEVAQRTNNLSSAFQSIGWSYIYTSHGFSSSDELKVWVIDPSELRISGSGAGALADTLIAVVAPTNGSGSPGLSQSLRVELTWDRGVDLDLHLVRTGYNLYDQYNDCHWQYLEQNWGMLDRTTDNPRLSFDDVDGYGPETIVMDEMTPGDEYTVVVDYWGDALEHTINAPVNATVRVWTNGSASSRTFYINNLLHGEPWRGDYRLVCDIDGATGAITAANRSVDRSTTRAHATKHDR